MVVSNVDMRLKPQVVVGDDDDNNADWNGDVDVVSLLYCSPLQSHCLFVDLFVFNDIFVYWVCVLITTLDSFRINRCGNKQ